MRFSKNKNFKKEMDIILSKMYWYESCEGCHILSEKLCGLFKFIYRWVVRNLTSALCAEEFSVLVTQALSW